MECVICVQVAFDFSVDLSRLSRPGIIEAYPSTGKVAAGEKARVKLKVTVCFGLQPRLPDPASAIVAGATVSCVAVFERSLTADGLLS